MRNLRTKTWAKALACVLCVASLTAAVFSFPFVVKLAEDGAYQNSCQTYISQTEAAILDDLTFYVRDRYQAQQQGEIWTDGPDRLNDPNFFYTIKDKSGKTLDASEELGDYRAKYSVTEQIKTGQERHITRTFSTEEACYAAIRDLEEKYTDVSTEISVDTTAQDNEIYRLTADYTEGGGTVTVTITGFIRSNLSSSGDIYQTIHQAENHYFARNHYLCLLVGGLLLGLLCLAFLAWSAGRHEDQEGVVLHWVDRAIPLELILCIFVLPILLGLGFMQDSLFFKGQSLAGIACCAIFALAGCLSLVRRWKAGTLGQNLLVRRLAKPLRRLGHALHRGGSKLMEKLPLFWTAALGCLLLFFLEGLCIYAVWCGNGLEGVWFLLKVLEAAIVIYAVISMRELQRGGRELAAGNLDYKVPLEKLRWDFKAHGENLNSMRTAIQAAVEDQMKSERMKTELITNVSHDIKTPLTSIVSYVDLLKKQEMPTPEAKEYLEVLDRQSAKLKKLTEDLVEAAKASTGSMTVNFQRTDVNVLLTQSAGEYQEKLQSKTLQLLLTPAKDAPAISADGRLLWRVFENLLSNIYKYALPGPRVYLTCESDENTVTITFRNISAAPLNITADELMERFVRGDDSRHTEGSGLGLSIARSLTQLQKGTFDLSIDGDLFKAVLTFPRIS
ncbi:sensor histidine kinase [Evtepia sp.]|uniref:sensor histidine kinase n=1 Tax=Evtepia sp. TaxID=2773933 RepID=UPI002A81C693|nr:sensor histidine kinase [Evtepia sp.]MDY4429912.1 sensor histidine kinase [Evtepia sp.]